MQASFVFGQAPPEPAGSDLAFVAASSSRFFRRLPARIWRGHGTAGGAGGGDAGGSRVGHPQSAAPRGARTAGGMRAHPARRRRRGSRNPGRVGAYRAGAGGARQHRLRRRGPAPRVAGGGPRGPAFPHGAPPRGCRSGVDAGFTPADLRPLAPARDRVAGRLPAAQPRRLRSPPLPSPLTLAILTVAGRRIVPEILAVE